MMKLNIFKRVDKLEEHVQTLARLGVKQSENMEALYERRMKVRVFTWFRHRCIIERFDFSGGDNTHYALIHFEEAQPSEKLFTTVTVESLQATSDWVDPREWHNDPSV